MDRNSSQFRFRILALIVVVLLVGTSSSKLETFGFWTSNFCCVPWLEIEGLVRAKKRGSRPKT